MRAGTKRVYAGRVLDLDVDEVEEPGGVRAVREVVRHRGSVAALPVHDDGRVVLIRQYRYAVGQDVWEIPAGRLDPGETPAEGARRELEEEVGLRASRLEPMSVFYTTPGFCDEVIHLFVATALTPAKQELGADEVIDDVRRVPLAEAMAMIARGEIRDGKTIAALVQTDLRYGRGASGERRP